MKHVVEAGTDVGAVIIFDPNELPDDFDELSAGQIPALKKLASEKRIHFIETGADGAYLLHAYIGAPVPEMEKLYAHDPITVEPFRVSSGRLYFAGAEYCFKRDRSRLDKYHGGGFIELASGCYRLTLWRTEYPDDLFDILLGREVTPTIARLHENFGCLVGTALMCFLGIVGGSLFVFYLGFDRRLLYVLIPILAIGLIFPFMIRKSPPFRRAADHYRAIQDAYPSIICELERLPA